MSVSILGQMPDIQWKEGPLTCKLGKNIANVDIDENYLFLDSRNTRDFMESIGNPTSGAELGTILPGYEGSDGWFILFEYDNIGYVSDDDKYDIDADAILRNIKKGTESANKKRTKDGFSPLIIKGWYNRPYYDDKTNNLTWAILAETDGEPVVNHNIRFLGRSGVMSVALVTNPNELDDAIRETKPILSTFSYSQGKRYFEFVEGDKIAGYGLTALIAGGAGAAAAKLGLFAKLWKFILKLWYLVVAAIIAVFNVIKKFFSKTVKGE
tara:strand:- start:922 stop:1725 length:804 start_codon:yes stop_codon:yes gene_type:complete